MRLEPQIQKRIELARMFPTLYGDKLMMTRLPASLENNFQVLAARAYVQIAQIQARQVQQVQAAASPGWTNSGFGVV